MLGLKKYLLKLKIAVLVLSLCLCACAGGVLPDNSYPGDSSGDMSAFSGNASENESSDVDPEKARFLAEAKRLLEKDGEITSLIILGGIYKDENNKDGSTVLYPLSAENEYRSFAALEALAGSVYSDSGSGYILNFPPYGTKTVKNVSGETWYSSHYAPDYGDFAVADTAKIVSCDGETATVSVVTLTGLEVAVPFVKTSAGWRMEECLYKLVTDIKNNISGGEAYRSAAMGAGSASALDGNFLIINVFINDRVSEWNDADVAEVFARLGGACEFIESMADFYGVKPDITPTGKSDSLYLNTTEKLPTDINDFVWMDLIFSDTVYGSLEGYAEHYFDLEKYDNWCVMFHLNKKGRSYAIPCDKANSDWERYTAERCAIFHSDDDGYIYYDSAGVYAHELLHLFGADDLYTPYVTAAENALLENYFPNDIMRAIPLDTALASVSPYTAFRLGWVNHIDNQFLFLVS